MKTTPETSTTARRVRIAFRTLGCRLNQYDTESMKAALPPTFEFVVVPWKDEADVYVLNSCTVTSRADQECRRMARSVKRKHPDCRVVVAGCYAQMQPEALEAIPEIDAVVGNTEKEHVADWLLPLLGGEEHVLRVSAFDEHPIFTSNLIADFDGRNRAWVKVQDGCECRCTYCTIWKARGPSRSRPVDEVLAQLALLGTRGHAEIVVAGIHLGLYGDDLDGSEDLVSLLGAALDRFPELRLRLSSIHPDELDDRLIGLYRDYRRLRPQVHLSLQSASDTVLERMGRDYGAGQASEAIGKVTAAVDGFGVGADIIVGFPGETDAEFAATIDFVEAHPFSYLHVFRYSPRPGTVAAGMPPVMPERVSERAARLRAIARRKNEEFCRSLLGTKREAVVEAVDRETGLRHATTDNYVTVLLPAEAPVGAIVDLRPTIWEDGKLRADDWKVVIPARKDQR